jgi:hypothetical protein
MGSNMDYFKSCLQIINFIEICLGLKMFVVSFDFSFDDLFALKKDYLFNYFIAVKD